jgi:hypothetical protein
MYATSRMATTSRLHQTNTTLAARGNVSLTLGSHIWFRSLEFIITKEGGNLDLVPPTKQLARSLESTIDLWRRSDELKNTWPDKFSLPDPP